MQTGRWSEALIVLERGSVYADVSSDLSYLLALARSRFKKPRGSVLQALRQALGADRWIKYEPEDARLMEAEELISMKFYEDALGVLSILADSPKSAQLRLKALYLSSKTEEFLRYTRQTLDRYPREPGPARIFLEYARLQSQRGNSPGETERQILDLVLGRLSLLLQDDPELAWMAAPYIRDAGDAARLVSAYRAVNDPVPASLPAALNLGLIDEETALNELFDSQKGSPNLDISLLETVWDLLRNETGMDQFRKSLAGFSGIITSDNNGDGIPEAVTLYLNGMPGGYSYDEDQDGLPELVLNFRAGEPISAIIAAGAEAGIARPVFPVQENDRPKIYADWERYPALLEAELDGERFIFRPLDFFCAPVQFRELWASGLLFPEKDPFALLLTRRVLIANSIRVERPSQEFQGAMEVVELNQSIPVRAREYLEGRLVSETDFLRGRPISQRVDLNLDGRLETLRHFRRFSLVTEEGLPAPEILLDYKKDYDYAESDWAGNGIIERQEF